MINTISGTLNKWVTHFREPTQKSDTELFGRGHWRLSYPSLLFWISAASLSYFSKGHFLENLSSIIGSILLLSIWLLIVLEATVKPLNWAVSHLNQSNHLLPIYKHPSGSFWVYHLWLFVRSYSWFLPVQYKTNAVFWVKMMTPFLNPRQISKWFLLDCWTVTHSAIGVALIQAGVCDSPKNRESLEKFLEIRGENFAPKIFFNQYAPIVRAWGEAGHAFPLNRFVSGVIPWENTVSEQWEIGHVLFEKKNMEKACPEAFIKSKRVRL